MKEQPNRDHAEPPRYEVVCLPAGEPPNIFVFEVSDRGERLRHVAGPFDDAADAHRWIGHQEERQRQEEARR